MKQQLHSTGQGGVAAPDIEATAVNLQLVVLVGLNQYMLVLLMPLKLASLRSTGN